MSRRILICLDDDLLASAVEAALAAESIGGVRVDPLSFVDVGASDGIRGLVVQDRYADGGIGTSMLRQLRSNRGEALPGVLVTRSDIAEATRHVLANQYGVQAFLGPDPDAVTIARAILDLAPPTAPEPDVVLHEDEAASQFHIEIASDLPAAPAEPPLDFDELTANREQPLGGRADFEPTHLDTSDSGDFEDEVTVGIPLMQAAPIKAPAPLSRDGLAVEPGGDPGEDHRTGTSEVVLEDFSMPAPGSSRDLELPVTSPGETAEGDAEPTALNSPPDLPQSPAVPPPAIPPLDQFSNELEAESAPFERMNEAMNEDEMQSQVQELKKALLSKKRALETAQKRIDELEEQLSSVNGSGSSGTTEGIPNEGMFEDLRYPVLLSRCRAAAFTGAIDMQLPGGTTRTIYISNGLPMAFSTSEPGEKIGKVLVEQKRITDEQYVKAATRMVERGIKLSEALVELGLISSQALEVEIRNLTRDQIIRGFELTKGRFQVHEGKAVPGNVPTFDFGPGEIYVEGYRTAAPGAEMQGLYEQLRPKYLIANTRLAGFRPKLGLSGSDERLLRLLGEAYTVEEAVERAKLEPEEAARLIAALQALDLVEEWSPGVEQFRARLTSERQHFADELARIRQENIEREQQLFEGFERALAKITSAMGGPPVAAASAPDEKVEKAEKVEKPEEATVEIDSSVAKDLKRPEPTVKARPSSPRDAARDTVPKGKPVEPQKATAEPARSTSAAENRRVTSERATDLPPPPGMGLDDASEEAEAAVPAASAANPFSTKALPTPQTPADQKHHAALDLANAGQLDEAEVTLREAVRMDASRPEYLVSLARILLANPRYERAGTLPVVRSLLDRAVQLSPDHAEAQSLHREIVAEMGG